MTAFYETASSLTGNSVATLPKFRAADPIAGATQTIGPDLDEVLPDRSPQEIEQSIVDPDSELSPGFNSGIMPDNFGDSLSPDELETLVQYLSQNAGQGGGGQ